ncbi:uncharacterized protein LOC103990617 [Musa acuminata AAA Group]|uniref:(wild Malaysian banana) hypothetical protein n=1 Tax=Musa acuminata subsp. malaccensis TaxID=214687 RepID=A0A804JS89_MUSAM|nr:PREDICTED: uncharacterized protein LOC103990617 [Musa acuminata subsp. malaccensis]CAG1855641.1 unnamed protein product [Musa acuminata subsp. malaccensis]
MAKFNVIQKQRRASVQDRKRAVHGDPNTRKLKLRTPPVSVSGKRKRKLFKKWRREQKEAMEKGLVTMEDVEMAVAEGSSEGTSMKPKVKFHLKKGSMLKLKRSRGKGKSKRKSLKSPSAPVDSMVE